MGRWHKMADNYGEQLGALYSRDIRRTLKAGIIALVENTKMDSGRAAAHWMVIPNKGGSPGSYAQMKFPNPNYGKKPVGRPGDKGKNAASVTKFVTSREMSRTVNKQVKWPNPATRFFFESSVPEQWNDAGRSSTNSYRDNARLAYAYSAAIERMNAKFNALVEAGKYRVNPLR